MKDTTKAQVMRLVSRMMNNKIEDKIIVKQITKNQHNSAIGTGDCFPLIPPITQGTDDWNRIGEKIKPKYLRVNCQAALVLNPTSDSPAYGGGYVFSGGVYQSPLVVRVLVFTQNDIKSALTGSGVDVGSLLRGDNGSAQAFTGLSGDLLRLVNTEKFKPLYSNMFELVPIPDKTVDGVYKTSVRFSFKVPCPATFKYDANSGNVPNNFCPFLAVGYAYPNQSPPDTTQTPLMFECQSILCYEDA